ncbi:hypothetical protein TNCV_353061 [Trichonephila clavipes]|nr:hypothetical protein TNCV_353061 [Trichonephila clavipes]
MKHHSHASRIPSFDESPSCHSAECKPSLSSCTTSKTCHDMGLRTVLQSRCPKKNAYSISFVERPGTRQRQETYTFPNRTDNLEGLQLAHLECYQPRSNEPDSIPKDTSMDLSLPSPTFTPRPGSPDDLTDRATSDSNCLKLQSIVYYIHKYEVHVYLSQNTIDALIKNVFNDMSNPDVKLDYYTKWHENAVSFPLCSPLRYL